MDIIYCAGGNKKLASIAIEEGFLYGSRSDDIRTIRCNGLIDINWKRYDWEKHLEQVAKHKPKYAVFPDITEYEDFETKLFLAEELMKYCTRVIIVPKIDGIIRLIPLQFLIGISIPTSYAGFLPDISEINYREVHFLGGTPGQQRDLWHTYKSNNIQVVSVDCNSHSKASDFGSFWNGEKWCRDQGSFLGKYETFRQSCKGIMKMWTDLGVVGDKIDPEFNNTESTDVRY